MISTLVFAGIIPSTAPAVDGSARTLICVEAVPSTGTTVGWGGGESGVSVEGGVNVGGRVEVMTKAVGEGASCPRMLIPHPARRKARIKVMLESFGNTVEL
jgi:hypothetical protein